MNTARCRTLIAEDEPLAAEALADWVRETPSLELVAVQGDGASALAAARELRPGLLLLDIQLPALTGLQLLRALAADDASLPAVIFTTAYDEHALTAFELHAVDYLLKPFSRQRFDDAIAHALALHGERERLLQGAAAAAAEPGPGTGPLTRVLVRDLGRIVPLQLEHVEYLRSDTKYTALVSRGKSYLVRLPITSFEQRLDSGRFMKVNRSCIVNLDHVQAMTPDENSQFVVQLSDGTRVTASREVSKQLRAQSL